MTFVAIFLVNAGLSFALSLVVASLIGPDAFGRYGIALSLSVVLNTALFEWLRLSTTRFYSERTRAERPAIGATLDAAYRVSASALAIAAGALVLSGLDVGLSSWLLAAAAASGLGVGLFDYRTAQARARFLDRDYAAIVLGRGILAFLLTAGTAWLVGDPSAVLLASAIAAAVAVLVMRHRLADPASREVRATRAHLATFARYALPLVAASAIYQVLPLVNRTVLASRAGFAEAGYFSLGSEIATRLFQNLGSALDLALFQVAVRTHEIEGPEAARRQVGRNIGVIAAIVLPAMVGLWIVWPAFEALFVPASFRGHVEATMTSMIPALAAYALVQYALNPVFQLRGRTGIVVAAAAAALALDVGLVVLWPDLASPAQFAAVQLASFGLAALVLTALAAGGNAALPWRDLALAALAAAVMGAALWPWRSLFAPGLALGLQVSAGALVYAASALAFDMLGARAVTIALLRTVIGRIRAPRDARPVDAPQAPRPRG